MTAMDQKQISASVAELVRKRHEISKCQGDVESQLCEHETEPFKNGFRPAILAGIFFGVSPPLLHENRLFVLLFYRVYPVLLIILLLMCFAMFLMTNENSKCRWFKCPLQDIGILIVVLGSIIHSILTIMSNLMRGERARRLINLWNVLEPLLHSYSNIATRWNRLVKHHIVVLVLVNLVLHGMMGLHIWLGKGSLGISEHLQFTLLLYMFMVTFLPLTVLLLISRAFSRVFDLLDGILEMILQEEPIDPLALMHIRLIHNYLCMMVDTFNEGFSLKLFTFFTGAVAELSITVYLSIFSTGSLKIAWIFRSIVVFAWMIITCKGLETITNKARSSFKTLCKIPGWNMLPDAQFQIKLFIASVNSLPVDLTAANYFTINRRLISTMFGVIASYVVILIQFDHQN